MPRLVGLVLLQQLLEIVDTCRLVGELLAQLHDGRVGLLLEGAEAALEVLNLERKLGNLGEKYTYEIFSVISNFMP